MIGITITNLFAFGYVQVEITKELIIMKSNFSGLVSATNIYVMMQISKSLPLRMSLIKHDSSFTSKTNGFS